MYAEGGQRSTIAACVPVQASSLTSTQEELAAASKGKGKGKGKGGGAEQQ